MNPIDPDLLSRPELLLMPDWVMLPEGPVSDHAVVVLCGRFAMVASQAEAISAFPQLDPQRLPNRLLMPGFVDTHHHLTQSFGKALAFGEPSEIFRRIWVPLEAALDADAAYLAAKLSALESLRGGFTTVVDAGTRSEAGLDAVASAAREAGIRCVLGMICNDAANSEGDAGYDRIVAEAQRHLARYESDTLIHPSLAISIPE